MSLVTTTQAVKLIQVDCFEIKIADIKVGEIAKDNQYQDIVNDNGGDFIPLVCETFGVWSPYALSILGSIADRTTVRNGLPRKFARRQLLQQLSVTLWRYYAKMILRKYSLTAEDEFPDFDIG